MIRARTGLMALALAAALGTMAEAQTPNRFLLAGYGSAGWSASGTDPFTNNFTASVSPLILYSVGDDLLFETELEFGLEGGSTETTLEYAQIDYLGFDRLQITAGKLLLPFGVFGERLHPTWINKLPSKPLIFGAGHGSGAAESLLPVLSDAGLALRFKQPLGATWGLQFVGYVTQGPSLEAGGHDEGEEEEEEEEEEGHEESLAPPVQFGAAFGDTNSNKMIGGRVGLVRGGTFEVYASGLTALYDSESILRYSAAALSVELRRGGLELRGEGVLTRQEFEPEPAEFETQAVSGFYLQASRRAGSWEPVVRWSRVLDRKVDGESVGSGHDEVAIGLDYWMAASVPLKFAWEYHQDRDDSFTIQWAFGF